jgi:hypothetical protein
LSDLPENVNIIFLRDLEIGIHNALVVGIGSLEAGSYE